MDFWTHLYTNHPVVVSTTFYAAITFIIALYSIVKQRQTSREKNALDFEADYKNNEHIRQAWQQLLTIIGQSEPSLMTIAQDRNYPHRASVLLILKSSQRHISSSLR